MSAFIPISIICLAATASIEAIAHWFDLWRYRSVIHRVGGAVVTAAAFGFLAAGVADQPAVVRIGLGAAAGIALEALNLLVLKLWMFPDDRLLFFRGRLAIILAAGIPWGALPASAPELANGFRMSGSR